MNSPFPSLRSRPTVAVPGIYQRSSTAPAHSSASSLNSLFGSHNLPDGANDDSVKSLIHQAFVPHIGVHASEDTDILARDKGFPNFKDLIRPYGESVTGKVTVRDSQGHSSTHEDFGIRIRGLADLAIVSDDRRAASRLNGIAAFSPTDMRSFAGGDLQHMEELVKLHLDRIEDPGQTLLTVGETPSRQSFYLLYLKRLLSNMPMSPHETFIHPVACIIAISSRNTAPIETLRNLYASGTTDCGISSYVNNDYIRYYVLVHDEDRDDITKSNALFDQMKKHFGLNCHLLRLRSMRTVITDDDAVEVPTCQWLSAAEELVEIRSRDHDEDEGIPKPCLPDSDASGIRTMVREMVTQSVIPFMERCITTWNDQVASRRRGLSGRFLSMSKRYFGSSSRSSTASSTSNYDPIASSYSPQSPEAQMRKLADYAFMLRDWKLAHGIYDLLRTDFSNDKAWKYHAGAQEMTALSYLLMPSQPLTSKVRTDIIDPLLDLSIYSYISRCSSTYSALRCLLVSVELLRLRGGGCADDAAKWAIRALEHLTPGTVAHALVTERIGSCYQVRKGIGQGGWGSRKRKMAMWKVLAAAEWTEMGRAGMGKGCLRDALQVYQDTKFSEVGKFLNMLKAKTGYGVEKETLLHGEVDIVSSPSEYTGGQGNIVERVTLGHARKKSAALELDLAMEGDANGESGLNMDDEFEAS